MSARTARTVIDGLEFARAEKELRGHLALSELARLQDCLSGTGSRIEFLLKGARDRQKRPVLRLEIRGALHLQCQRCLGGFEYRLQIVNTLLLVHRNEVLPMEADEPDAPDCVVAESEMDVAGLIEEEILLSLPLSPRHQDGACSAIGGADRSPNEGSPFARLAALKKYT